MENQHNKIQLTKNIDKTKRIVGYKQYEMANLPIAIRMGNVLNVVTDRKVGNVGGTGYEADIVSYSDYYPYGMLLPGRVGSEDDSYRYGFQGQEMDDEIKGEGNSVNYKYRMHDPRIGRFFAVDPLAPKYPKWSPYAFSGNQVIHSVELEGLETEVDLDPSENGKFIGTPRDSDGHLIRQFKINPYNDSRSSWTFTIGQQLWLKKPLILGDPSNGKPFGFASEGTEHYSTDVRYPLVRTPQYRNKKMPTLAQFTKTKVFDSNLANEETRISQKISLNKQDNFEPEIKVESSIQVDFSQIFHNKTHVPSN